MTTTDTANSTNAHQRGQNGAQPAEVESCRSETLDEVISEANGISAILDLTSRELGSIGHNGSQRSDSELASQCQVVLIDCRDRLFALMDKLETFQQETRTAAADQTH